MITQQTEKRPSSGVIDLQARFEGLLTWLAPAWGLLCGLLTVGAPPSGVDGWLAVGFLLLLVDGGWGTLWHALASTDWSAALDLWERWSEGAPAVRIPYALPGSIGEQLSRWLGQLGSWWQHVMLPACGPALRALAIALPLSILLSIALGREIGLLSLSALAIMQIGLIWSGGSGRVNPEWDAMIGIALPWLAAHLLVAPLTSGALAMAVLMALAYGTAWRAHSTTGRLATIGCQILASFLLVGLRHPLGAGSLALMVVPQMMLMAWLDRTQSAQWYVRHSRPWLFLSMLLAAIAI